MLGQLFSWLAAFVVVYAVEFLCLSAAKLILKDVVMKALDQKSVDLAEASRTSNFIKRIQVGQRVRLRGLSYSELNDAKGVVIASERGGRVTVKLTHASSKMLQQHRLETACTRQLAARPRYRIRLLRQIAWVQ